MKNQVLKIKTKYSLKAFLPLILSIPLVIFIVGLGLNLITEVLSDDSLWVKSIIILFFLFVSVWLVFGEVRNKFISVKFFNDEIVVSKFGGLLPIKHYTYDDIDYWTYSILESSVGEDEYLYLYKEGHKVAKISEFYHRNYTEVRNYIDQKIDCRGFEKFKYLDELKEIFN